MTKIISHEKGNRAPSLKTKNSQIMGGNLVSTVVPFTIDMRKTKVDTRNQNQTILLLITKMPMNNVLVAKILND